jgi:hypothetical protein
MDNTIREALNRILENDLDGMKTAFNTAITERAVDKLEERKIAIASSYFGNKK